MSKKRGSGRLSAGITGAGLGIAAGAALGAYVLNPAGAGISFGSGAAAERDSARQEAAVQRWRAEESNRAVSPLAVEVVRGALREVPVLVIATPDANEALLAEVGETLRAAEAPDAGVVQLTDKFVSAQGADELKDVVAASLPTDTQLDESRRDPGRQAGLALAPVLTLNAEGAPRANDADRALLLGALREGGFIDYREGTLRPAQAVVIVGEQGSAAEGDKEFGAALINDFAEALAESTRDSGRVVLAVSPAAQQLGELRSVARADQLGFGLVGALGDPAGQIGLVRAARG